MDNFEQIKGEFNKKVEKEDGYKIMQAVTAVVNDVGTNFLTLNGGELAEAQSKLAGYKFYLADYIADLNRQYESLKLEIKNIRANKWDEITETIKAKDGKVKNKEQIENVVVQLTGKLQAEQILYETLYYKYKLKISSIDSLLTAITQRISELKRQMDRNL